MRFSYLSPGLLVATQAGATALNQQLLQAHARQRSVRHQSRNGSTEAIERLSPGVMQAIVPSTRALRSSASKEKTRQPRRTAIDRRRASGLEWREGSV